MKQYEASRFVRASRLAVRASREAYREQKRSQPNQEGQPLTARQLEHIIIKLLIVGGVIALIVVGVVHANQASSNAQAQAQCALNAPAGWNCAQHPTGYPGQP